MRIWFITQLMKHNWPNRDRSNSTDTVVEEKGWIERRGWVEEWRRTRTSSSRIGDPRERIWSITSAGRVGTSLSSESSASPSPSSSTRASSKILWASVSLSLSHSIRSLCPNQKCPCLFLCPNCVFMLLWALNLDLIVKSFGSYMRFLVCLVWPIIAKVVEVEETRLVQVC